VTSRRSSVTLALMPLCNFNTVLPVAILLRARDKINRKIKIESKSDITLANLLFTLQIRKIHYANIIDTP